MTESEAVVLSKKNFGIKRRIAENYAELIEQKITTRSATAEEVRLATDLLIEVSQDIEDYIDE